MMKQDPLQNVVYEFSKMPGIGHKSAQRLAFYLLSKTQDDVDQLITAISDLKKNVGYCTRCFHLTYNSEHCNICSNRSRDQQVLCLVSESKDIIAIEKMRKFNGLYHVLGGVISPLDGIGPEQLRIKELLQRLKQEPIQEIILALTPTIEGETTAMYISRLLQPIGIRITQIAHGIPVGGEIDWADELTLSKAFDGRHDVGQRVS